MGVSFKKIKLNINLIKLPSIIFGTLLIAFAVAYFIVPSRIIFGGVTGLSLLLNSLFGYSVSTCIWIINMSLFVLGFFIMGKSFTINTLICSMVYPLLYELMEKMKVCTGIITGSCIINVILASIVFGIGAGVVLRQNASTGGVDTIAKILNYKWNISVSKSLKVMEILILFPQIFFATTEHVFYGILYVLLFTNILNIVVGFERKNLSTNNK